MKRMVSLVIVVMCVIMCLSGCSGESEKDNELRRLKEESAALDMISDNLNKHINDVEDAWDDYQKNKEYLDSFGN